MQEIGPWTCKTENYLQDAKEKSSALLQFWVNLGWTVSVLFGAAQRDTHQQEKVQRRTIMSLTNKERSEIVKAKGEEAEDKDDGNLLTYKR